MLVVRNDDRPGMIGQVGTILGEAGVNIADMDVGQAASGASAMMVLATTEAVPAEVARHARGPSRASSRSTPSDAHLAARIARPIGLTFPEESRHTGAHAFCRHLLLELLLS